MPTPLIRLRLLTSPLPMAEQKLPTGMLLSTLSANLPPMPLTVMSSSNNAFSSGVANPNNVMASSRTWVQTSSVTASPGSGKRSKVLKGMDSR